MTDRFKGLDLIDRVPEELWMEIRDTVQEAVIKTIWGNKGNSEILYFLGLQCHKKLPQMQRLQTTQMHYLTIL